jgi:hypothetical protein
MTSPPTAEERRVRTLAIVPPSSRERRLAELDRLLAELKRRGEYTEARKVQAIRDRVALRCS